MNKYKDKYTNRVEEEEIVACDQEFNKYNLQNKRQLIFNIIEDEFKYFINASPTNFPTDTTAYNQWLNLNN